VCVQGTRSIGDLLKYNRTDIGAYCPYFDSKLIDEFSSVRNAIAHYWMIPFKGQMKWPRDQLRDKAFAWHYDEARSQGYTGWQPACEIINEHLQELIRVQDAIFGLLVNELPKFQKEYGLTIV
jgi:hypothetical protein